MSTLFSKLKPSEKIGSDIAQKAQTTIERNWRESQGTMGRLSVIQLICNKSMGRLGGILTNIQQLSCILIGFIFYCMG